jgi:DNA ligase (NAD+)
MNKQKVNKHIKHKQIIDQLNNDVIATLLTLDEKTIGEIIKYTSYQYYNTGIAVVNDQIYDMLVDRLKELNPNNKILQSIGANPEYKRTTVQLPYHMGSMDKIKPDKGEVDKWIKKYNGPYVISDKLDGLSGMFMMLKNGTVNLYNRGNGDIGTDLNHLINHIDSLKEISKKDLPYSELTVRGEFIISRENFKKYEKTKKNARNMVSGIINSKRVNKSVMKDLEFVAYEVIKPKLKPSEQYSLLKQLKFDVVYNMQKTTIINEKELETILDTRRKNSPYEIDGVIVIDDNIHNYPPSGNPKYAFAFKTIRDEGIKTVKVVDVKWNISKDGYLKPIIDIEPVDVNGVTIKHATGFNAKYIVDNNIGIGSIIKIIRSGDVIPYVLEVVKGTIPKLPDVKYKWTTSGVDILIDEHTDDTKKSQLVKELAYFFKKMEIDGASEKTIEKIVDVGLNSIKKILTAPKNKFLTVENFGSTMATKIYENIHNSIKNVDLVTLMVASNKFGHGFGEKKIKMVLDEYPDLLTMKSTKKELIDKIIEIEGFDTKTATQFISNLPKFISFYNKIKDIISISKQNKKSSNGIFNDMIIVFTGFRNKEWEKIINSEGGKITGNVSSNTSLVVAKDINEDSSKLNTARSKNILIMSIDNFKKKYNLD